MAGEAERHRARCTALLVRRQNLREQAAKVVMQQAKAKQVTEEVRRQEAAAAAAAAATQRTEVMRSRYAALVGASTGAAGLQAVQDTRERLTRDCARADDEQRAAGERVLQADAVLRDATTALMAEVRCGRKRGRMAEVAGGGLRALLNGMEEARADEDTGDRAGAGRFRLGARA